MAASTDDLSFILQNGRESLDIEFKTWQNLDLDHGKAIIANGCMALRNINGGYLVIGMEDDGSPHLDPNTLRSKWLRYYTAWIVIGVVVSPTVPTTINLMKPSTCINLGFIGMVNRR